MLKHVYFLTTQSASPANVIQSTFEQKAYTFHKVIGSDFLGCLHIFEQERISLTDKQTYKAKKKEKKKNPKHDKSTRLNLSRTTSVQIDTLIIFFKHTA